MKDKKISLIQEILHLAHLVSTNTSHCITVNYNGYAQSISAHFYMNGLLVDKNPTQLIHGSVSVTMMCMKHESNEYIESELTSCINKLNDILQESTSSL